MKENDRVIVSGHIVGADESCQHDRDADQFVMIMFDGGENPEHHRMFQLHKSMVILVEEKRAK